MKQLLQIIMMVIVLSALLRYAGNLTKYEGKSAKYWYQAYDELEQVTAGYKNRLVDAESRIEGVDDQSLEAAKCVSDAKRSNTDTMLSLCEEEKKKYGLATCPGTISVAVKSRETYLREKVAECIMPLFD